MQRMWVLYFFYWLLFWGSCQLRVAASSPPSMPLFSPCCLCCLCLARVVIRCKGIDRNELWVCVSVCGWVRVCSSVCCCSSLRHLQLLLFLLLLLYLIAFIVVVDAFKHERLRPKDADNAEAGRRRHHCLARRLSVLLALSLSSAPSLSQSLWQAALHDNRLQCECVFLSAFKLIGGFNFNGSCRCQVSRPETPFVAAINLRLTKLNCAFYKLTFLSASFSVFS